MFRLLAVALALYVLLCVVRGAVHAKRGAWGERIEREVEPQRFWLVIAVYAGLAAALWFVF
ncbi:MAG: hypothetical protein MUC68_05775 [Burkholderiaceae bacterium]|jgi:hypothetical protein|nr:hypothetical protein [Burkholderiaceae bacterium]